LVNLIDGHCDKCGPDAPRQFLEKRSFTGPDGEALDGYDFYECQTCGVRFYSPRYDEREWLERVNRNTLVQAAQLERTGSWFDADADNVKMLRGFYRSMWDRAIRLAGWFHPRVLEVGCHVGHSLVPAIDYGLDVWAIEPDINAAKFATEKAAHAHVQATTLLEAEFHPSYLFDIIIMNDTIEHTFTPWQDLQRANALSRVGAVLMVKTFAEDMAGSDRYVGLGHEWHFPTQTLIRWIHEAGWDVLSVEPQTQWAQVTIWANKRQPTSV